jgi:Beta-propeller repeat
MPLWPSINQTARCWTRQLGTSEGDSSSGVATDGEGNVYISAQTEGSPFADATSLSHRARSMRHDLPGVT